MRRRSRRKCFEHRRLRHHRHRLRLLPPRVAASSSPLVAAAAGHGRRHGRRSFDCCFCCRPCGPTKASSTHSTATMGKRRASRCERTRRRRRSYASATVVAEIGGRSRWPWRIAVAVVDCWCCRPLPPQQLPQPQPLADDQCAAVVVRRHHPRRQRLRPRGRRWMPNDS